MSRVNRWETPDVSVEVVDDHTDGARCDEGFLRLRRLTLRNRWADGLVSEAYRYDMVERTALDAVVIVLWARDGDEILVTLRSSLRPPLAFRSRMPVPVDPAPAPVLWEVPAGLVEADEHGDAGLRACAARETREEAGFTVAPSAFRPLGAPLFLSPGVLAEKLHFFETEVDLETREVPTEDGSPVEQNAVVRFVSLSAAMDACRDGRVADIKSEVALRRLSDLHADRHPSSGAPASGREGRAP